MALAEDLINLLLLILPALAANGAPVVARRIYGRGTPLDMGRKWIDGRRILGEGKTLEGFVTGMLTGFLVGIIEGVLYNNLYWFARAGLLAGIGAMIGDLVGSFIKRRLGIERGEPAPLLDQLDFYVGALIVLYIGGYSYNLVTAVVLAPLVVILHITTNRLAYKASLKEVPH
ncbi:MAG: CDP-2,3-bis-(O-geranylgeranyl)-sn-glycerol synthase [Desulfurococcales archaeon]|nr:CDP-2,3-bis-(O-geranylgeranyl)-sn-glycerol synthase [Desulfurococcales archaeon]